MPAGMQVTGRRLVMAGAIVATAFVTAACGSSGGGGGAATTGKSSAGLDAFNAKAEKVVAAASADLTSSQVQTKSPAIVAGKSVYAIPAAMTKGSCQRIATAMDQAAAKVGWQHKIIDPAGDPTKFAPAIDAAVAAGADGIMVCAIDSPAVAEAVKKAKAAGVAVHAVFSVDQDGSYDQFNWPSPNDVEQASYAEAAAAYLHNGKKLNVAIFEGTEFAITNKRVDGVAKFAKECQAAGGNCSVTAKQNILLADLNTTAGQTAVGVVQSNPKTDSIFAAYDPMMQFIQPALQQAGLTKAAIGLSSDGNDVNLANVRKKNFQLFDVGGPMEWIGYGLIDNFNRQFAGQKPVPQGYRLKLLTSDNAPASGDWKGDINHEPLYTKLWGTAE